MPKHSPANARPAPSGHGKQTNQLRIIGGQWRGRKVPFPDAEGLRPTSDRIRETLFNWLAPYIAGARCLDLFAGSGALGLEALSRGAGWCSFVDATPAVTRQLDANLLQLGKPPANTSTAAAQQWLKQFDANTHGAYDILFLDPPFGKNLLEECLPLLSQEKLLAKNARVYLETGRGEPLPALPATWQPLREKTAGQVCYRLYGVESQ